MGTRARCSVRNLQRADAAFAALNPSNETVEGLLRANAWRRPVYFTVTCQASLLAGLRERAELEGLVWRIPVPGEPTGDDVALQRFVRERLPRSGLADPRQVLEPENVAMMSNYLMAGTQLAMRQARRGETTAALQTLDLVEHSVLPERLPAGASGFLAQIGELRGRLRASMLRDSH